MSIDIIYEDSYLIAVNKPPNILVTPNAAGDRSLTGCLNSLLSERGDAYRAHPCHRLDRETSGVMLFAKGKKSQKAMMAVFEARNIQKYYIALVSGTLDSTDGHITSPIDGRQAHTEYHIIAQRQGYAIVHIRLHTGRTNQIRIHFASAGHPLLGESKFAYRRDFAVKFRRTALHCESLEFRSPFTMQNVIIAANLPDDLRFMIENDDTEI